MLATLLRPQNFRQTASAETRYSRIEINPVSAVMTRKIVAT
jgi:hypothetical protein